MRVRVLSRQSALAVLQARLVERALRDRWPSLDVSLESRSSAGDRDSRAALWTAAEKGLFTADLSQALFTGDADAVVHSWKDLPLEGHAGTRVAATLERADPRDVLLVKRAVVSTRPSSLVVLSSSPRRAWQIQVSAPRLLPWPASDVRIVPVRGNVPTRLSKLIGGDGDALIVAKAGLDRLLSADAPEDTATAVRGYLDRCRWMVLPLREHPTAPAQGAVAVEIAAARSDLADTFAAINHPPTWSAVEEERRILQSFGGGCHAAVGATVLVREYGRVTSVRARVADGETAIWALEPAEPRPPRAAPGRVFPRPEERAGIARRPLDVAQPSGESALWVSRAEALPARWTVTPDQLVWAAGLRTWERLAARGVWVNGCADGLGDGEAPDIDALAGKPARWLRLTHAASGDPAALATYETDQTLPADLASRSHFFWTSGSMFTRAVAAHPGLAAGWHASGPGRTARVIRDTLGSAGRLTVWLDYDQWHQHVTS
jgi:hydroxymethylbilane synthase